MNPYMEYTIKEGAFDYRTHGKEMTTMFFDALDGDGHVEIPFWTPDGTIYLDCIVNRSPTVEFGTGIYTWRVYIWFGNIYLDDVYSEDSP